MSHKYVKLVEKILMESSDKHSKEFLKWFRGSKIVDKKGKPKLLFRGDRPGVKSFKGPNIFLFDDPKMAKFYTKYRTNSLMPVDNIGTSSGLYSAYVNMKKPLIIDAKEESWLEIPSPIDGQPTQIDDVADEVRGMKKYDGLVVKNVQDQAGWADQYIVFSQDQVWMVDRKDTTDPFKN